MERLEYGQGDRRLICQAVLVALGATQVRRAWHASVIDSDAAMHLLDDLMDEIICVDAAVETDLARNHPVG
jgi:hypothetical protein